MDSSKKEKSLRRLYYIFAFAALAISAKAQTKLSFQTEVGHTNVSEGMFLKTAIGASYEIKGVEIETALESDVISEEQKLISGWNLSLMKEFELAEREFSLKPYFIYSPFSDLLTETNWGVLMGTTFNKLSVSLGAGFRRMTYSEEIAPEENRRLYENFILLYNLKYSFLNEDSKWKLQAAVTNTDHFLIHQATNPVLSISGAYQLNNSLALFSEFRYKTAGMMNMHVNYFGTLLRAGIVWEL